MHNIIDFKELLEKAKQVCFSREVSPFIESGSVAAAILTKKGHIYVGVCIDTNFSLGMCAERNAIANMITNQESKISKIVCYSENGKILTPCGSCRENLMQLDSESGEIEILLDSETYSSVKLKDLLPNWWGNSRPET